MRPRGRRPTVKARQIQRTARPLGDHSKKDALPFIFARRAHLISFVLQRTAFKKPLQRTAFKTTRFHSGAIQKDTLPLGRNSEDAFPLGRTPQNAFQHAAGLILRTLAHGISKTASARDI